LINNRKLHYGILFSDWKMQRNERGTEQRSKAKTLELIQNLHDNAAPIPFIAEVIGLPVEEVQTIIKRRKEMRTKKVPVTDRYLKSHPLLHNRHRAIHMLHNFMTDAAQHHFLKRTKAPAADDELIHRFGIYIFSNFLARIPF
jgi:hypothetical protein